MHYSNMYLSLVGNILFVFVFVNVDIPIQDKQMELRPTEHPLTQTGT